MQTRIKFLNEVVTQLGLTDVETIHGRAEDFAKPSMKRETYDACVSRAVANLASLSEYCLPYVKVGGKMIAMKGRNAEFELSSAKKAIAVLGGGEVKLENITLDGGEENLSHPLIMITKKNKTPPPYPRPYSQISKKPL